MTETTTEFGWRFDDGEVWRFFDSPAEATKRVEAAKALNADPARFAGHVVARTRTLTVTDWEPVS